jgi:uncharacterized protein YecE (DUF72 family)
MKIHIGTSGYGYKEWKGKFYPETISPKEMLGFYSRQLAAVEINNTFYRMPAENILKLWAEQVPADFVFAFKAPQVITHRKRLKNVDEETAYLFRTLSVLGDKLGPVLFQFPRNFRVAIPLLKSFLALVPGSASCAFEFRSPLPLDREILDLLAERGFGLCTADTDEVPAGEIVSTASWGYLRLRRSGYGEAELKQWLDNIRLQPWDRAFVFFKHEEEAIGPQTAIRFRELVHADET